MYHYTYMLEVKNPTDSRFRYIGVRSCKVVPEEDVYFGSCRPFKKWQAEHGTDGLVKTILARWGSRADALSHEILLHDCFDIAKNPEFWNQAKQTAVLFDTTGTKQSDELRLKKSLKTKGRKKTEEHKAKIAAASLGRKLSEETKLKLRQLKIGKPSPLKGRPSITKGKPKSEEHKLKIGLSNLGKKRSPEICAMFSKIQKSLAEKRKNTLSAQKNEEVFI